MSNHIKPISISDFPKNIRTNCFGFAVGDTESLDTLSKEEKFNMDHRLPIEQAVIQKFGELGYELPRRIHSADEVGTNEVALLFFDFTSFKQRIPFMDELQTFWTTHVVRFEKDGTCVHKPGWKEPPCEICTDADWQEIFEEFGREYVLFAAAV